MLSFLGIGAQKAGTSWLHAQLRRHPQIGFPGGKEMHFWDRLADPSRIPDYLASFSHPERKEGEITPAYAILDEPTIARIKAEAPELRLVYLLRNPVERAWSSALMALGRAEMTIDEASEQWFTDHFQSSGSLRRGDYAACIECWMRHFPSEQLLLLRYEDITTDPEPLLARVCRHIGVSPPDGRMLENVRDRVFTGPGYPLPPRLRDFLLELYRPRIAALENLVGEDFSNWLA